jgi:prepilin-type N-terminal cleavage/methylation domain-containing protein
MKDRAQIGKKKQKGFSLLELTVVIAVVFGLIGFGISAAPSLFSSMNSVGELSELPTVIMNVKKTAKDRANYNGLTIDT